MRSMSASAVASLKAVCPFDCTSTASWSLLSLLVALEGDAVDDLRALDQT